MKVAISLAFGTLALLLACGTEPVVEDELLPEWLNELIEQLESEPVANPPLWIARYEYQGQVVYYLPPRCCDIPSNLYDADGNIICHPDGGFSGGGDGRCPTFFAERKNEVIVWRDSRGATQHANVPAGRVRLKISYRFVPQGYSNARFLTRLQASDHAAACGQSHWAATITRRC